MLGYLGGYLSIVTIVDVCVYVRYHSFAAWMINNCFCPKSQKTPVLSHGWCLSFTTLFLFATDIMLAANWIKTTFCKHQIILLLLFISGNYRFYRDMQCFQNVSLLTSSFKVNVQGSWMSKSNHNLNLNCSLYRNLGLKVDLSRTLNCEEDIKCTQPFCNIVVVLDYKFPTF